MSSSTAYTRGVLTNETETYIPHVLKHKCKGRSSYHESTRAHFSRWPDTARFTLHTTVKAPLAWIVYHVSTITRRISSILYHVYWFGGRAVWVGGPESAMKHPTRRSWVRFPRPAVVGGFHPGRQLQRFFPPEPVYFLWAFHQLGPTSY